MAGWPEDGAEGVAVVEEDGAGKVMTGWLWRRSRRGLAGTTRWGVEHGGEGGGEDLPTSYLALGKTGLATAVESHVLTSTAQWAFFCFVVAMLRAGIQTKESCIAKACLGPNT